MRKIKFTLLTCASLLFGCEESVKNDYSGVYSGTLFTDAISDGIVTNLSSVQTAMVLTKIDEVYYLDEVPLYQNGSKYVHSRAFGLYKYNTEVEFTNDYTMNYSVTQNLIIMDTANNITFKNHGVFTK